MRLSFNAAHGMEGYGSPLSESRLDDRHRRCEAPQNRGGAQYLLRKAINGITQHMLTAQLRELENDGLITRTVFAEVPPRVEYEMTAKARALGPTMKALWTWWNEYGKSVPVKPASRGRKAKSA